MKTVHTAISTAEEKSSAKKTVEDLTVPDPPKEAALAAVEASTIEKGDEDKAK